MLRNKTAIVTGSTSGIGLGIAHALAEQGANIVLNGFGDPHAIELLRAGMARDHGVEVLFCDADMSIPRQVRELVALASARMGRVDILVNNAGIQHTAPVEEFPDDKWDAILAINLSSNFHAIKAALPHMRAQGAGRIVNIASVHGLVASTMKSAYVAAKHGVIGLTRAIALETAGSGITCNAVCPGWVLTPLVQKQIDDLAARLDVAPAQAQAQLLSQKQPSGQFATPEQVGALVAFLCSAPAAQISGAAMTVDGGWTAQ
ncbi:3-hydroxybutyrate dehydrogenase [Massilia sp. TSP1-1-2]|uniref:3-hydroxybutyrate dehydrogenase n=1 Tax=unclassified Massilia TaxID=2609279 RepID=UPI003CF08079